jgi:CheY-like chemotaxis protein
VELMGGELQVVSSPGEGSIFTLFLPTGPIDDIPLIDLVKETPVATPSPVKPVAVFGKDMLAGAKILLAEDGPENQRLFQTILTKAGASIQIVDNGADAVHLALHEPFDVVLMDMQMPEMDGYAAARALRATGYARPIVALTAFSLVADRDRCLQAGCTDYISKPVDRQTLLETVARHVTNASSLGGAVATTV